MLRENSREMACWAAAPCAELEASRESLGFLPYKVGAPALSSRKEGQKRPLAIRTQAV